MSIDVENKLTLKISWRPPSPSLPLRPVALRAPYQAAMARSLLSPQPPQPRTLSAALLTALQRCMLRVSAQGSGAESPAPHFPVSHVRRPPVEQGRGPRWNSRTWLPPRVLAPSPCQRICQTKTKSNFLFKNGSCGLFLAHLMRSASIYQILVKAH